MKYGYNFKGSNLCLVVFLSLIYLFNCIIWLLFDKYIVFVLFVLIGLFIMYMYFYTYYTLEKEEFIIHLGFIKIRTKYSDLLKISEEGNKINFKTNNFEFSVYPVPKDKFVEQLMNILNPKEEAKEEKPVVKKARAKKVESEKEIKSTVKRARTKKTESEKGTKRTTKKTSTKKAEVADETKTTKTKTVKKTTTSKPKATKKASTSRTKKATK